MVRRRIYKNDEPNPFWNFVTWALIAVIVGFICLKVFPQTGEMLGIKSNSSGGKGNTTSHKVVGGTKGLGKAIKDKF